MLMLYECGGNLKKDFHRSGRVTAVASLGSGGVFLVFESSLMRAPRR
jgi:hypothetical protein